MNLEILQNIRMKTWRDIHFCVIHQFLLCTYIITQVTYSHISFHKIKPNNSTIFVQELTVNHRDTQPQHKITKEAKISTKAYFFRLYFGKKIFRSASSSVWRRMHRKERFFKRNRARKKIKKTSMLHILNCFKPICFS